MVEIRSIRATACFLFFSLLVSQRLGSCASINEQGRPFLRLGENVADDPTGSLSNRGVSCLDDGKAVVLHTEISEGLSDEALQSCRKTLTKGVIQRRLQSPEAKIHHVDPSSSSKSLPRWAIYTIAIGGALVFVAIAAATVYLLFSRRKKDTTVMPWSTGLSGPLSKAFVAGVPSLGRAELQAACEDFINVIGSWWVELHSGGQDLTEDYAAKISDAEFRKEDGGGKEYAQTDDDVVYRFGILLLEVISGRLPFSEDHGLLVLWASSYLDGKRPLRGMVDPTVRSAVPEKDLEALRDVVRLCVRSDNREKRPAMGEVVRALRGVTGLSPEQVTPRDNPLWWAELEIASAVESE